MNLLDSAFLCLDVGTRKIRGAAHRVQNGRITKSAIFESNSDCLAFAAKSVAAELEKQIGTRFESAHVTGDFGDVKFFLTGKSTAWNTEHRITADDILKQANEIESDRDMYPMHMIPLRYDTAGARNLATAIGHVDTKLGTVFGGIFYPRGRMKEIANALHSAYLQTDEYLDPIFLMASGTSDATAFIDFGESFTSFAIWTARGPVFYEKIPLGGREITNAISKAFNINITDAERVKLQSANMDMREMDRFAPADAAFDFSRAELNEVIATQIGNILANAKESYGPALDKYEPKIMKISGGGSDMPGITQMIEYEFGIAVTTSGGDAAVKALSDMVWRDEAAHVKSFLAARSRWQRTFEKFKSLFRRRKRFKKIPIMPSSMSFDIEKQSTLDMFGGAGISMIHIDIMDGFYVDRVAGGMEQLSNIRAKTRAHLHVHLMTESPTEWAAAACDAGADTVIVSTGTAGARTALRKIREMKKRCGIALNTETSVGILKPILRDIDEVLVMSVKPGAAGQDFIEDILPKISTLANTRKKYGLKYKISVDGGINADTAKLCWGAGADYLVSGSYLAKANNFAEAVQSLLPNA